MRPSAHACNKAIGQSPPKRDILPRWTLLILVRRKDYITLVFFSSFFFQTSSRLALFLCLGKEKDRIFKSPLDFPSLSLCSSFARRAKWPSPLFSAESSSLPSSYSLLTKSQYTSYCVDLFFFYFFIFMRFLLICRIFVPDFCFVREKSWYFYYVRTQIWLLVLLCLDLWHLTF